MRLFVIFIFNIYISSKVKYVSSEDCLTECKSNQLVFCIELTLPDGKIFYTSMYDCAVKQFKCMEKSVQIKHVEQSKCHVERPVMKYQEPRRVKQLRSSNPEPPDDQQDEKCPSSCPTRSAMVCARNSQGIHLSFLSNCYLKMYQCKHPEENLELVSRHSCYAFAPVLSDLPRPADGTVQSRGQDDILDFIDAREDKEGSGSLMLKHKKDTFRPPKPTITWHFGTKKRRTTRHHHKTTATKHYKKTTTRHSKPVVHTTTHQHHPTTTTKMRTTTEKDIMFHVEDDTCDDDEEQDANIKVPDTCASSQGVLSTKRLYMKVDLSPMVIEDTAPIWQGSQKGARIFSTMRADMGFMLRCEVYAGIDYTGNVIVNSMKDDDFVGLVFGYQSNKHFYIVTWKSVAGKYWRGDPFIARADAGVHIKLVNSSTGPDIYLRNSIYSTESSPNQVTLLWQDPQKIGWKHKQKYKWRLIHRPHIGLIRIKIFKGSDVVVDSGNIFDSTYNGGRLGVFCFSQEDITWSGMKWKCNDKVPSNVMSELPEDLQKKSIVDKDFIF